MVITLKSTLPVTSAMADSAIAATLPKAAGMKAEIVQLDAVDGQTFISPQQLQDLEKAIAMKLAEVDPEADAQTQQLRLEFTVELIMSRKSQQEITSELSDIFDAAEGAAFTEWLLSKVKELT